jgi:hypothetical protein
VTVPLVPNRRIAPRSMARARVWPMRWVNEAKPLATRSRMSA